MAPAVLPAFFIKQTTRTATITMINITTTAVIPTVISRLDPTVSTDRLHTLAVTRCSVIVVKKFSQFIALCRTR